jgi:hypothetical protein
VPHVGGARLEPIDYDLHGVVGIRLLGATRSDARAVDRQLGFAGRPLTRDPDIVIRFVDDLSLNFPLHYLGVDDSAFTQDAFLVLQGKHKSDARVKIPFEHVGGRCEIVCESGLAAVPLLIAIINMTALAKGVAPLHASAFVHRGVGVLVTGWSKGGKTEALLAFASRGAEYVGDEWIYLSADAKRMYGIPEPIRLWDWHLEQFDAYRRRIGWRNRVRLRTIRAGLAVGRALTGSRRSGTVLDRIQSLAGRQTYVDIAPDRLFGPYGSLAGSIDRVFLVGNNASPQVAVRPISAEEVARRMVHSVRYEFEPFMSHYLKFKFAFPGATNQRIEALDDCLRAALHRGLQAKPAYAVDHPYPMSIAALYDAMSPLI